MTRRFLIALLTAIGYVTSPERWSAAAVVTLLAVVGAAFAAFDIYQIVTGTVDLNRHLPGLVPAAIAAFIAIVRGTHRADSHSASSDRAE